MSRINYLIVKSMNAIHSGVFLEKFSLFLKNTYQRYFFIPLAYFFSLKKYKIKDFKKGYEDHRNKNLANIISDDDIKRIIDAYKKSKDLQKKAPENFAIRGLWDEWIKVNYKDVIISLKNEDLKSLRDIFNNLFRERCGIGTGGYDEYHRYRSFLGAYYLKYVWNLYFKKLLDIDFDFDKLDFPLVGNPCGIIYDEKIIPIEALRHAYRAYEINNLVKNYKKPKIVEIGGGLGGLAFQLFNAEKNKNKNFILFDIPEVVALSSFFLISSFPEKEIVLFGEEDISFINKDKFDLALLPHFTAEILKESSVDVFYNSCSFSEMDKKSSGAYLEIIEKASKKYFMHDNHDYKFLFNYTNEVSSENIIGSRLIPDDSLFKRIYKKPRVHGLPEDKAFTHFEYLYEKIK